MEEVYRQRNRLLVQALRSGRFSQGYGSLSRDNTYCCLGVACMVAKENGLELHILPGSPVRFGENEQASYPPRKVFDWYGWRYGNEVSGRTNPALLTQRDNGTLTRTTAARMNDNQRCDFHEIANAFECTYVFPLTDEAKRILDGRYSSRT